MIISVYFHTHTHPGVMSLWGDGGAEWQIGDVQSERQTPVPDSVSIFSSNVYSVMCTKEVLFHTHTQQLSLVCLNFFYVCVCAWDISSADVSIPSCVIFRTWSCCDASRSGKSITNLIYKNISFNLIKKFDRKHICWTSSLEQEGKTSTSSWKGSWLPWWGGGTSISKINVLVSRKKKILRLLRTFLRSWKHYSPSHKKNRILKTNIPE